MKKVQWAYDLHIHSALSPCGDNDMTPNNIINMARLKGLDIIAVTDHNSTKNLPALFKIGEKQDLLIVPGIEVTTKEEVHILCYFLTLEDALKFDDDISKYLPSISNDNELFGEQLILNEKDKVVGEIKNLLISALDLSVDEIFLLVQEKKGIAIPAHVDKTSFSMISNLGFIPPHLPISTLEVSRKVHMNEKEMKKSWKLLKDYHFIQSSDAHYLEDILERQSFIALEHLNIRELFHTMR